MFGRETDPRKARLQGDEDEVTVKDINTPIGTYPCPQWLINPSLYTLVIAITIFIVLIFVPIMSDPAQQNCLALVVFVSLLWATEVSHYPIPCTGDAP
jgi:phosphate transporter